MPIRLYIHCQEAGRWLASLSPADSLPSSGSWRSKYGPMKPFSKIVSGVQTGADRAALDWALAPGVPCGGWCPKDRKAEDGPIDARYPLKETSSASYIQRTEWNVRDSDATILFSIEPTLTGGSLRTMEFARKHRRVHLHLCAADTKHRREA
jgi:hypothetical protein